MFVVYNDNLPRFRIVMANPKQYLINQLSRMRISIVQRIKLFSTAIGDVGILGHQIKIKAWHEKSPSPRVCVCLERHALISTRFWFSQLTKTIITFAEKLLIILIKPFR